jgi:hypothetical protein
MGMPGKALEVVLRSMGTKVIEEQKGVMAFRVLKTKGPFEVYACPFKGRDAGNDIGN